MSAMADAEAPFLLAVADDEAAPLAGVSDFRGRPVRRAGSGGWRSALFVCGTYSRTYARAFSSPACSTVK